MAVGGGGRGVIEWPCVRLGDVAQEFISGSDSILEISPLSFLIQQKFAGLDAFPSKRTEHSRRVA